MAARGRCINCKRLAGLKTWVDVWWQMNMSARWFLLFFDVCRLISQQRRRCLEKLPAESHPNCWGSIEITKNRMNPLPGWSLCPMGGIHGPARCWMNHRSAATLEAEELGKDRRCVVLVLECRGCTQGPLGLVWPSRTITNCHEADYKKYIL